MRPMETPAASATARKLTLSRPCSWMTAHSAYTISVRRAAWSTIRGMPRTLQYEQLASALRYERTGQGIGARHPARARCRIGTWHPIRARRPCGCPGCVAPGAPPGSYAAAAWARRDRGGDRAGADRCLEQLGLADRHPRSRPFPQHGGPLRLPARLRGVLRGAPGAVLDPRSAHQLRDPASVRVVEP